MLYLHSCFHVRKNKNVTDSRTLHPECSDVIIQAGSLRNVHCKIGVSLARIKHQLVLKGLESPSGSIQSDCFQL